MSETSRYDVLVVGGGPGGQKAALQAAKAGRSVLVIDRGKHVGGECVYRGTIPSKTLRETAVYLAGLRQRCPEVFPDGLPPGTKVSSLMRRLRHVLDGHREYLGAQLDRNDVEHKRGRVRFVDERSVEIVTPAGNELVSADTIVIATGSRPRTPPEIPIDHEYVLDSDSILSLIYLPKSLTVMGGGVIASEFASMFAALGVSVTMVDRYERPLGWLDPELTDRFLVDFESRGGRFLSQTKIKECAFDGVSRVRTVLENGEVLESEKFLCAQGRTASVDGLRLERAGLNVNERGYIPVDENLCTAIPHIYAVGDVIGPPALAATAMEQGRLAMRHALELGETEGIHQVPLGIYTVPEMSSVGLTEAQAIEEHGSAIVGRSPFAELARGQITGNVDGLLKLVACPEGKRLLGAHIVGDGATELIHVAQMAMMGGLEVDTFFESVLNFPTLAEAYRVAALDIAGRRQKARSKAA